MDTSHLTETTSVVAYKSDLKRIALIKIQKDFENQQDIIKYLLDYYHEKELTKQSND